MYFIDQLKREIKNSSARNNKDENHYFENMSRVPWLQQWIRTFTVSAMTDEKHKEYKLGQLVEREIFKGCSNKTIMKAAFFFELLKCNKAEDEDKKWGALTKAERIDFENLEGYLGFLLSCSEAQNWLSHKKPGRYATQFVNEELAEFYMRLLATYWREIEPPRLIHSKLPDSIYELLENTVTNTEIVDTVSKTYISKRKTFRIWLNAIGNVAARYDRNQLKGFGLGGKLFNIGLGNFVTLDKLFFRDRLNDLNWLKIHGNNPKDHAKDDQSKVYNYCDQNTRQLNCNLRGAFPISLLLILILEHTINKLDMKVLTGSGTPPRKAASTSESDAMLARNLNHGTDRFVSPAEEHCHQQHVAHFKAKSAVKKAAASRFVDSVPSVSSSTKYDTLSDNPNWRTVHYGDDNANVEILSNPLVVKLENEDGFEECHLRARDTLEIEIPAAMLNGADFGVVSFFYWVTERNWLRFYIPHRQVCVPGIEVAKIYLELGSDCMALFKKCEPSFLLNCRTELTLTIDAEDGVLQLFVMATPQS